ncbi:membrane-bound lytic murein transglycosylase B [Microbulbifer donghaiensis]|uniref:Membrane-bound lytic murein transglycosylase B n=1 Tax=Microbulbifer donghaiensis TaxID=494016 RepID=A0A1M5EGK0_9GAMM|nr:lytic murein transglycosylase [Microbulbifer donghaiensis]SHF78413.1 membrane-bound lytic murein transglycosylase B [Microbulbifer donghaiensis]
MSSPRQYLKLSPFVLLLSLLLTAPVAAEEPADPGFQKWVQDFRKTAIKNGISGEVYDRAFKGITSPDQWVLDKAAYQPEFKAPVWQYFDNRVQRRAIERGKKEKQQLQPWLEKIEQRFGVNPNILLAIWSVESSYGGILDNDKVMRSVIRSLATLAYADPQRKKFGRQQLLAALKILQSGDIDESHLTGSWAGAMGHTQFIPTSYQAYAVDIDGDGKRDIWNSVPDALATAASLLSNNGWRKGETWGYEVTIPDRKLPAGKLTIGEWEKLGVKRANGEPFPRKDDMAELKLPDGRKGPAFLMLKNFFVIKRYNNSDRYATAIGLLGDQIGGAPGLVKDWDRPFTPIDSAQVEELQRLLKEKGFYKGEIDGKAGSGTRKAVRAFEKSAGVEVKGYPSKEVIDLLQSQ